MTPSSVFGTTVSTTDMTHLLKPFTDWQLPKTSITPDKQPMQNVETDVQHVNIYLRLV